MESQFNEVFRPEESEYDDEEEGELDLENIAE